MTWITPARLGLLSALCIVAAAVLALSDEAVAAPTACDDPSSLQRRLDEFDARWNASDVWGLTAQFADQGSLGPTDERSRLGVYRSLLERLAREAQQRRTRLIRATEVGSLCLVDVQVRIAARSEAGLFLLSPGRDGGIVAMR